MRWLPILHMRPLTWVGEPLAALISLQTLLNALNVLGYPAVIIFVMIESSGIPFPGETMLLLAAFYAAVSQQLQIPIVIACAALGAIIGDNIGYYIGRTGGRALVTRYGKYVRIKPEHLDRAEKFFAKHGNKTVFFGRFIAVLRAWAAFLAGVNKMPWRTFFFYNAAGGILWATLVGTIGFFGGRLLHDNFALVEHIVKTASWLLAAIVVALILLIYFIYLLRRKRRRAQSTAETPAEQVDFGEANTTEVEAQPVAENLNHKGEATRPEIAPTSDEKSEAPVGSKETPRDTNPP
jgi:membrane protein DedA with SNARE-associated domain